MPPTLNTTIPVALSAMSTVTVDALPTISGIADMEMSKSDLVTVNVRFALDARYSSLSSTLATIVCVPEAISAIEVVSTPST